MNTKTLTYAQRLNIPATIVTVTAAVLLPVLVHLLPTVGNVPTGARLLPIFYAPLLAVIFLQPSVGIVASLVAPFINHVLTGSPTYEMTIILTLELTFFSVIFSTIYAHRPKFVVAAPFAYLLAKVASLIAVAVLPVTLVPTAPLQFFTGSLMTALPGMVVLLVLNIVAVQYSQKDG